MVMVTSALQASELVFYSDAFTTASAALEVLGASTFTITGVGGGTAIITNLSTPVNPSDAVNKAYVDSASTGLTWKSPVVVTTTANITLSGLQTIDSIAVTAGQRVLVNNQTTMTQNGIYVASAGAWARASDMTTGVDASGYAVYTEYGTANGGKAFVETLEPAIVGTDSIQFTVFASIVPVTPGGSNGQLQYNLSGSFGGAPFSYDGTNFDVTTGNFTVDAGNFSTTVGTISSGSSVTAATDITATAGNVVATAGQVNAGTSMTAGTGVTATTGNVVATAGQVNAGTSMSATTTVTAGTGMTSTTGNVIATAGQVNAGTSMTAGTGVTATTGNVVATAGQVNAGTSMSATTTITAGTGMTATTGNVVATAGNVVATAGNVVATAGQVNAGTSMTAGTGITATTGNITASAAASIVQANGTTDATSTSTGALTTAGGLGVAKQAWVGTNLTMPGAGAVLALTDSGSSVAVSGTTNATTSSTGSITTAGGVGVVQDIYCGGNVYATSFKATSDATMKTNIMPLTGTLNIVKQIEGFQYNWKDQTMGSGLQTGVLAQQLEEIGLDHMVDNEHSHKSVNYLALFPYLIGAIKELSEEVEELRTERKQKTFVPFGSI